MNLAVIQKLLRIKIAAAVRIIDFSPDLIANRYKKDQAKEYKDNCQKDKQQFQQNRKDRKNHFPSPFRFPVFG